MCIRDSTLTDRENEVLRLAAEGLSDQEIALRLLVSEPVVHSHVAGIVERLRLADRSQTLLLDFANRAQSHKEPAALHDFLVVEIPRLLDADAAALLLPEPGDGHLTLRAAHNWPAQATAATTHGATMAFESHQPWQDCLLYTSPVRRQFDRLAAFAEKERPTRHTNKLNPATLVQPALIR